MYRDNYICISNKGYESYLDISRTYYVEIAKEFTDDIYEYNIYLDYMILYVISDPIKFSELLITIREDRLNKIVNR